MIIYNSGILISFAIEKTNSEKHGSVESWVGLKLAHIAGLKARNSLFLFSANEYFSPKNFSNREALANALLQIAAFPPTGVEQLLPGLQSFEKNIGNYGLAAVLIYANRVRTFSSKISETPFLNAKYCSELYAIARAYFKEANFNAALPLFKEIHHKKWFDPDAYLDAADCFIQVNEKTEAEKILFEIMPRLESELSATHAERTGDLFFKLNKQNEAQKCYELALKRLHSK